MARTAQTTGKVLRVVVFKDDELWIGQCLEHDITATAATVPLLREEILRALAATIAVAHELSREPFEGIDPAPQHFFEMYERAQTDLDETHPSSQSEASGASARLKPKMRLYEQVAA